MLWTDMLDKSELAASLTLFVANMWLITELWILDYDPTLHLPISISGIVRT